MRAVALRRPVQRPVAPCRPMLVLGCASSRPVLPPDPCLILTRAQDSFWRTRATTTTTTTRLCHLRSWLDCECRTQSPPLAQGFPLSVPTDSPVCRPLPPSHHQAHSRLPRPGFLLGPWFQQACSAAAPAGEGCDPIVSLCSTVLRMLGVGLRLPPCSSPARAPRPERSCNYGTTRPPPAPSPAGPLLRWGH